MNESDFSQEAGLPESNGGPTCADDVAEVPLLLPVHEADALEEMASHRGLTAGQMLRRLIRDFLHQARGGR
jgi:hypothetical protein